MTATRSSIAPVSPPISTMDRVLGDRRDGNLVLRPLWNLRPVNGTMRCVPGYYSSRSNCVYQGVIRRVSEELRSQLQTKTDTKDERAVLQQLDTLLPAALESEIQASLDIAQTKWIASLKGKMAQMIKKIAPAITSLLLLELQVFIEKRMSYPIRSQVDGQLPDTNIVINKIRTKVERVLCYLCTRNCARMEYISDTLWKTR